MQFSTDPWTVLTDEIVDTQNLILPLHSDLRSLDFVLDRFFMKLFRTSNAAIVRQCQELFGFQLPSITLCKRVDKFVGKYYASDNLLCKICSKFV